MGLPVIDNMTSLLSTFLDVQSRRSEVVASNLANVDTPGYVAKELDFADFLHTAAQESLTTTTSQNSDAGNSGLRIVEQQTTAVGLDGNTVDAGREMSSLAEAGVKYLEGTQLLQMRLRTLRAAIRG
jgi:flagellar basal-body rod protein FlgB